MGYTTYHSPAIWVSSLSTPSACTCRELIKRVFLSSESAQTFCFLRSLPQNRWSAWWFEALSPKEWMSRFAVYYWLAMKNSRPCFGIDSHWQGLRGWSLRKRPWVLESGRESFFQFAYEFSVWSVLGEAEKFIFKIRTYLDESLFIFWPFWGRMTFLRFEKWNSLVLGLSALKVRLVYYRQNSWIPLLRTEKCSF